VERVVIIIIISLLTIDLVVNLYLSVLNYKSRFNPIAEEIQDVYCQEKYQKWQDYYMEKYKLSLMKEVFDFVLILILLLTKAFVYVFDFAASITNNIQFQSLILIGAFSLLTFIINIGLSYYSVFVIEEKYGFNKMTKKLFVIDKIKSLIFSILLGGGLIYGLISLYLNSGGLFFIIAWISASLLIIVINLIYTKVIVPIFNKLKPLEDSSLKQKIYDFADKVGYEVNKISVIDASKRSTKLNAYFSGFGKVKQVVLYDTLIDKMTEEEIVAVLAHEIGHSKHKHIIFNLVSSILTMSIYILFIMIFFANPIFSTSFGFSEISYGFSLILYMLVLSPIFLFENLLSNYISRKFEYQADRYAAINYDSKYLISALKILSRENFSNLTPHPLYVKFYYSHPPLAERIKHLNSIKKGKS
jgi:STE24 endopeptidase